MPETAIMDAVSFVFNLGAASQAGRRTGGSIRLTRQDKTFGTELPRTSVSPPTDYGSARRTHTAQSTPGAKLNKSKPPSAPESLIERISGRRAEGRRRQHGLSATAFGAGRMFHSMILCSANQYLKARRSAVLWVCSRGASRAPNHGPFPRANCDRTVLAQGRPVRCHRNCGETRGRKVTKHEPWFLVGGTVSKPYLRR